MLLPLPHAHSIDGTATASDRDLPVSIFRGASHKQGVQNEAIMSRLEKKKNVTGCWDLENVCSWEIQIAMAAGNSLESGKDNGGQVDLTYFPYEKLACLIPHSQWDFDISSI